MLQSVYICLNYLFFKFSLNEILSNMTAYKCYNYINVKYFSYIFLKDHVINIFHQGMI